MVEQTERDRHPASSPSRPGRARAGGAGGSGSRRSVQPRGRAPRRWSECRKSLQTPGFDGRWPLGCGGDCVQEEGEYEYASWQHGAKPESGEPHIEPAILVQPLNGEAGKGEEAATLGSAAPLCKAGSEGPCARPARGGEGTCKSCRKRRHSSYNVRIRATNGSWTKVFETYCGIVGGAASPRASTFSEHRRR
jgi:hypothetical protein